MSENKKGKTTDTTGEFANPHTKPKRDERGRIIIHDLNQIPKSMNEDETVRFWDTHAMSEELLDATYIAEEDEDLPAPRKCSYFNEQKDRKEHK